MDQALVGRRVAAVVKTGGWATHALVDAGHLVPVPDSLDAAEAETVVLNGITAWQMLHKAKVGSGQTILVHGANGGVGNTLVQRSFRLLAPGGTLVAYGTASQRDDTNNVLATGMGVYSRLAVWSLMPNGRRALFCNFWAGKVISPKRFWQRLAADLGSAFSLLAKGVITPHVAARMPLAEVGAAMALAESRTAHGKVVLIP